MEDIGLQPLRNTPGVSIELFAEWVSEVSAEQASHYDAIISPIQRYAQETSEGSSLRLCVVARLGVGYDGVDVGAFTEHDAIVTITPDGVRRPMAGAVLTLLLALAHELMAKDRQVREGRWQERKNIRTTGLTGRTFGSVGLGNIGREVFRIIKPFEMVHLATDPFVKPEEVADLGVELVDLETLMRRSDFVSIHCPLTSQTLGLISEREISWMKPSAYFINTSRGPVVDQGALYRALRDHKIRGAGLDVFEKEPISGNDPLLGLDNVILTPHTLCWTDQCLLGMAKSAIESVLSVLRGEIPPFIVNREVLERPGMRAKLKANRSRWLAIARESRP
jgi:D-3-phosphoglycerate dehydrogenase